jgi:hypothetical protein
VYRLFCFVVVWARCGVNGQSAGPLPHWVRPLLCMGSASAPLAPRAESAERGAARGCYQGGIGKVLKRSAATDHTRMQPPWWQCNTSAKPQTLALPGPRCASRPAGGGYGPRWKGVL